MSNARIERRRTDRRVLRRLAFEALLLRRLVHFEFAKLMRIVRPDRYELRRTTLTPDYSSFLIGSDPTATPTSECKATSPLSKLTSLPRWCRARLAR